ncbi:hypothetical protein RJ640_010269 [Escallonia rubra]|uniref:Gamma-interferon-inducible lysosomal thiol reductase n=1 Tax=Escallonia rubra TaxID=112253 RepID=A0AA88U808_9ASTE|nr:hypothetical protein RJ640_010269 [Escallonia rubra]
MGPDKPVLACVLLLLSVYSCYASSDVDAAMASDDYKVTLSLYYESLCPYCAGFIVNQLRDVVETDLRNIVNLRLVPWGNTQRTPNHTWICQHGRDECVLNVVEACAINIWPDLATHFKFIQCIERFELEGKRAQWQSCFGALGLNPKPVTDCYKTRTGVDLDLRAADETDRLSRPHRFVPWVLVNNKPLAEDYQNFIAYVCKAYRGSNKPEACTSRRFEINLTGIPDTRHPVCYARQG